MTSLYQCLQKAHSWLYNLWLFDIDLFVYAYLLISSSMLIPSIFYYHIFSNKYFKAISGQIFMNLFQDTQNSLNFICLSDSNFCLQSLDCTYFVMESWLPRCTWNTEISKWNKNQYFTKWNKMFLSPWHHCTNVYRRLIHGYTTYDYLI
jgi:hypothetical protein